MPSVYCSRMGVIGSHCQLCRLPLHHDHYVPTGGAMLKIYRTCSPDTHRYEADEPVVRFGPEHAWLRDAVALPFSGDELLRGPVEDGILRDVDKGKTSFIWEGDDEALAFHVWCWELMGAPKTADDAVQGRGLHAFAVVEAYGGQLFEHHEFRRDGFGWMLEDPGMSTRSRERIEALHARAKRQHASPPRFTEVRELLAADRSWAGLMLRDEHHAPVTSTRYRTNLHTGLDTAAYPTLVWAMQEYDEQAWPTGELMQELIAYEAALIDAVQRDAGALVLMTTTGADQMQYLVQARDEAATRALIDALPGVPGTKPIDYDNEQDPTWTNFFTTMNPQLYRR